MTFYERLNSLCRKSGTTITGVCKLLGISSGTVSAWKTGAMPRGDTVRKIAEYLGVSTDYLLTGKEPEAYETSDIEEEIFDTIAILREPKIRKLVQRLTEASQSDLSKIDKLLDLFLKGAENG